MNEGYQNFGNSNNGSNMAGMCCQCLTWLLICATCPISVPILLMMCCMGMSFPMMGDHMPGGLGSEGQEIADYSGTV